MGLKKFMRAFSKKYKDKTNRQEGIHWLKNAGKPAT
jgi:hypothetical protein